MPEEVPSVPEGPPVILLDGPLTEGTAESDRDVVIVLETLGVTADDIVMRDG